MIDEVNVSKVFGNQLKGIVGRLKSEDSKPILKRLKIDTNNNKPYEILIELSKYYNETKEEDKISLYAILTKLVGLRYRTTLIVILENIDYIRMLERLASKGDSTFGKVSIDIDRLSDKDFLSLIESAHSDLEKDKLIKEAFKNGEIQFEEDWNRYTTEDAIKIRKEKENNNLSINEHLKSYNDYCKKIGCVDYEISYELCNPSSFDEYLKNNIINKYNEHLKPIDRN